MLPTAPIHPMLLWPFIPCSLRQIKVFGLHFTVSSICHVGIKVVHKLRLSIQHANAFKQAGPSFIIKAILKVSWRCNMDRPLKHVSVADTAHHTSLAVFSKSQLCLCTSIITRVFVLQLLEDFHLGQSVFKGKRSLHIWLHSVMYDCRFLPLQLLSSDPEPRASCSYIGHPSIDHASGCIHPNTGVLFLNLIHTLLNPCMKGENFSFFHYAVPSFSEASCLQYS